MRQLRILASVMLVLVLVLSVHHAGSLEHDRRERDQLEADLAACRVKVADKDKEIEQKDEEILAVTILAGQLRKQLWEMEEKFQPELHKGDRGVLNENPPLDP